MLTRWCKATMAAGNVKAAVSITLQGKNFDSIWPPQLVGTAILCSKHLRNETNLIDSIDSVVVVPSAFHKE